MVKRPLSKLVQLAEPVVTGLISGAPHIFGFVWISIPVNLIKQPNGSFS